MTVGIKNECWQQYFCFSRYASWSSRELFILTVNIKIFRIKVSPKYSFNFENIITGWQRIWSPWQANVAPIKRIVSSGFPVGGISIRSPWKLFIFTICKNVFWMKVSKKDFILFRKQKHWLQSRLSYLSLNSSVGRPVSLSRFLLSFCFKPCWFSVNRHCQCSTVNSGYSEPFCTLANGSLYPGIRCKGRDFSWIRQGSAHHEHSLYPGIRCSASFSKIK